MFMYASILAVCAGLALAQPACAIEEPPSWQIYNVSNSDIPDNQVFEVETDKLGRVWLGCSGITLFDGTTWKNFSATVLQIGIASDNTAWCACDLFGGSLVHCDGTTTTSYNDGNSDIPSNWVTGVTVDSEDRIWAACNYTGVGEFDGTSWTRHLSSTETGGGYLVLEHDRDNTIWLGSGNSLYRYSGNQWTPVPVPGLNMGKNVTDIVCAADGSLWVGTDTLGVAHYADGEWTFYSAGNGALPDSWVLATALDSSGVLWVGTPGGLTSFDGATWETRTKDNWVLPDNRVRAIAVGVDNALWVGTSRGLLYARQATTSVGEPAADPLRLAVLPNPVLEDGAGIRFTLSAPVDAEVEVYAVSGERVAVVAAGVLSAGEHSYTFDTSSLAAGSYYCIVSSGGRRISRTPFVVYR